MTLEISPPQSRMTPAATAGAQAKSVPSALERYRAIRAFTEQICGPLATEDYVIQTIPDVSPAKWHLAHTTWFFECFVLQPHMPGYEVLHPMYNYLFNSYYNTVGYRHCRPKRGLISRPTVAEVYEYRAYVDRHMAGYLAEADPATMAIIAPLLEIGMHHEQQHQELMVTDIKHVFGENPLFPAYAEREASPRASAIDLRWLRFDRQIVEIGHSGKGFAFDNEGPRHEVLVHGYELADRPVTNGEYRAFIEDGGYERHDLWLSMGWNRVQEDGWNAPLYWQDHDDGWKLFTLAGVKPLDPAEPVCHVSYFEADAYARWAGARLPSEFEWERAASEAEQVQDGTLADGMRFHPAPAAAAKNAASTTTASSIQPTLLQATGEVWEWTRSPYEAYPGYAPAAGALGEYNGKFMCNQYVLRGGSCATHSSHIRSSYRNFFPPDARWQFSGIRLARDLA